MHILGYSKSRFMHIFGVEFENRTVFTSQNLLRCNQRLQWSSKNNDGTFSFFIILRNKIRVTFYFLKNFRIFFSIRNLFLLQCRGINSGQYLHENNFRYTGNQIKKKDKRSLTDIYSELLKFPYFWNTIKKIHPHIIDNSLIICYDLRERKRG